MDRPDHALLHEWLNLEADGCLSADQQRRLDEHVAGCPECQRERQSFAALGKLPAAGWEGRHPRGWALPAAICLLLGGLAVVLLGQGAAGLGTASSALLAVG